MQLFLFLCLFLLPAVTTGHGLFSSASAPIEEAFGDDASLTVSTPASPDCWLDTIRDLGVVQLDSASCMFLDASHQQALSLQLTRCHLQTMGRPLIDSPQDEDEDVCRNIQADNVADCLPRLSEVASTTYTLFFKDIHYLCTRLLQESISQQYFQSSRELAQISKLAESRLSQMVEQQEEAMDAWQGRERAMTKWLEHHAQQATNQTLQLQEDLQILQQQQLKEHKEELQSLASTVKETRLSLTPFSNTVDFVLAHASTGYSIFKALLVSFGLLMVILLLTAPQRFKWMRFRLCMLVLLGGGAEIALHLWLIDDEELSPLEKGELARGIQEFTHSALLIAFLEGILWSLCCGGKRKNDLKVEDENEVFDQENEKSWKRQEELLRRMEQCNQQMMFHHQQHQYIPTPGFFASPHEPNSLLLDGDGMASSATAPPHHPTAGGFSSPTLHHSQMMSSSISPWKMPPYVYQGIPVITPPPKEDVDASLAEPELPVEETSVTTTSTDSSKDHTKKHRAPDVQIDDGDGIERVSKRQRTD